MNETPHWLKKAKETASYHRDKCLSSEKKWTIMMTARALRRSFGSIAEDLLIAKWSKTHDLGSMFEHAFEALNFIRQKQKEQNLDEVK